MSLAKSWNLNVTCVGTVSETWRIDSDEPITAEEARRIFEEDDSASARISCTDSTTEDERDREIGSITEAE